MIDLYLEDRLREEGFESVGAYLKYYFASNVSPPFFSVRTFISLRDAGLIIPGMAIRTTGGNVDEHYWVTEEGKLRGETGCPYPGKEGIFEPEEILQGDRIADGWTIENLMKFYYLCQKAEIGIR